MTLMRADLRGFLFFNLRASASSAFYFFLRALCVSVVLFAGCSGPGDLTSKRPEKDPLPTGVLRLETSGRQGGRLRYPLPGEPSTFNLLAARDTRSRLVAYLTTGTLLEFDAVEQKVTPGLAREWRVSDDGRQITLTLRQGVRFSDGKAMTAADVLFTFDRIYQETSRNALKDALLWEGKPIQVSSPRPETVQLRFPQPYAAAPYILTTVPVLPSHLLDSPKKIEEYWNLGTSPLEMAGLGPFVLARHEPGQRSVFRYNPHYWKVDRNQIRLPYLDELIIEYVEDRNAQLLRFQAGELDLLDYLLRPEDYVYLKELANPEIRLHNAGASASLSIFWFNLNPALDPEKKKPFLAPEKKSWFSSVHFRRAVSAAISRESIVKNVYLGQARPAWTIVPSSIPGWHAGDVPRYPYHPEGARALLREAGFAWRRQGSREILVDSKGRPVRLEILSRADDVLQKTAALIQQDLEKLGMQVSLQQEEFRSVISRIMGSYNYDAALMNLEFPLEPADHLNVLLSSGPMHMWHPGQSKPASQWEERIDLLMLRQLRTLDTEERRKLYREVQHILAEQVPILPLVNKDILVAHWARLNNVRPSNLFPFGLWNVGELWVGDK